MEDRSQVLGSSYDLEPEGLDLAEVVMVDQSASVGVRSRVRQVADSYPVEDLAGAEKLLRESGLAEEVSLAVVHWNSILEKDTKETAKEVAADQEAGEEVLEAAAVLGRSCTKAEVGAPTQNSCGRNQEAQAAGWKGEEDGKDASSPECLRAFRARDTAPEASGTDASQEGLEGGSGWDTESPRLPCPPARGHAGRPWAPCVSLAIALGHYRASATDREYKHRPLR